MTRKKEVFVFKQFIKVTQGCSSWCLRGKVPVHYTVYKHKNERFMLILDSAGCPALETVPAMWTSGHNRLKNGLESTSVRLRSLHTIYHITVSQINLIRIILGICQKYKFLEFFLGVLKT